MKPTPFLKALNPAERLMSHWEFISESVPAGLYCLAVRQYAGTAPSWLQLRARKAPILQHHTLHHSIGNPAESANPGLLAVGAAPASDTNTIESYSSQGPTPDGRIKPDIVGVARAQSVSYRSEYSPDGRWTGTSQASSHIAGLAALVKQRFPQILAAASRRLPEILRRRAR